MPIRKMPKKRPLMLPEISMNVLKPLVKDFLYSPVKIEADITPVAIKAAKSNSNIKKASIPATKKPIIIHIAAVANNKRPILNSSSGSECPPGPKELCLLLAYQSFVCDLLKNPCQKLYYNYL